MSIPITDTENDSTAQNLRGVLFMLSGFFVFSIADVFAKILTETYHPVQIVWTRQLGLVIGVAVLLAMRGPRILKSVMPRHQIVRGFFAIISAVCFVFAIAYVPLADAVAVSFLAPFMVTILGAIILREPVGVRRWAAVIVGFVGSLIIIRPGFGAFHPAILLVVLAAAAFAARQIISRQIGTRDPTETTVAYTSVTAVAVLLVPMMWFWTTPANMVDVGMMLILTAFAGLGEYLIIRALEIAHAVLLAPMQYSLIVFSSLWGYIAFSQLPDIWTWIGTSVIVFSGLYVIYRESAARQRARSNK